MSVTAVTEVCDSKVLKTSHNAQMSSCKFADSTHCPSAQCEPVPRWQRPSGPVLPVPRTEKPV